MMLMSYSEHEDYITILKKYQYSKNDFQLNEQDETPYENNSISPITIKITIKNTKTGKEKTYQSGHATKWLSEFEEDIRNNFFNEK